ncbi:MAG: TM0106 family RecB-like putative nuclease [Propionibacteriaceae bacterium]|nr:TM0106 family RecB-like putative nuclease [Propionibacteriaceae bacterium]
MSDKPPLTDAPSAADPASTAGSPPMTGPIPSFALDQYAATSCPVKTQNTFNPRFPHPEVVDAHLVERFREMSQHRTIVVRYLLHHHHDSIADLSGIDDSRERMKASVDAMSEGIPIILAAQLPTDWVHHRQGTVDVLFRSTDDDLPRYHPAVIKDRCVLSSAPPGEKKQLTATLAHPFLHQARMSNSRYRVESQSDSLLHLAHLWHLLGFTGFATEEPWGAVIGADHEDKALGCDIAWIDLNDKLMRAFSYTSARQWRKYSPLSRFQHEHRFRVRVASHALLNDRNDAPELVASPVHVSECDMCEWWPQCQSVLTDDISVKIERSPLDAREIMTLRSLGISTITDLTNTDIETLLPEYLPRVAHRFGAENRLRLAARRGRLLGSGKKYERLTTGSIRLPSAPMEIDMDIETSAGNHVYLWGFLVHDRSLGDQEPVYHAIHRFSSLSTSKELELAEEAATWLMDLVTAHEDTPVLVWHYSNYELSALRRFARAKPDSTALAWLNAFAYEHFIDIFPTVKDNFFGIDGLGLKAIASAGAGFSWRDPDPSGLNSQYWFSDAVHAPTIDLRAAARTRILEYNEDDVRATWALRQWIRSLT